MLAALRFPGAFLLDYTVGRGCCVEDGVLTRLVAHQVSFSCLMSRQFCVSCTQHGPVETGKP